MTKRNDYAPAKRALLGILEILKENTSEEKRLTIKEIGKALKMRYDIAISRNTVKDSLRVLADFYGADTICCKESSRGGTKYTTQYFYKEPMTEEQIDGKLKKIQNIIKNTKSQENLAGRNQEIWIKFRLYGYGLDNELHPFGEKTEGYPIKVFENMGKYYLAITFDGKKTYNYRVDLIENIEEVKKKSSLDSHLIEKIRNKDNDSDIQKHPLSFSGDSRGFKIEAKYYGGNPDNGLTYLHDIFGSWLVMEKGEKSAKVFVYCTESAMEILLRQYKGMFDLVKEDK